MVSFSLFETDPEVQGKYFAHMKTDADLEKHGVRVFNAIGAMVKACKDEDDGKLIEKIHEVLSVQGWAKEWSLGCVNSPPAA